MRFVDFKIETFLKMGNKSCKYATGSDGEEKDTRIYRSINSPEGLLCCLPDSKLNLRSMFFKSCNQYAGKNFLGKRHSEKHKYAWMTYEEALSYSEDLAKSIIERELFTKSDEGLRLFGICSQSCPETTLLDFACLQAEITSVSIDYGLCDIKDNDEESFQMQTNSKVEKFKTIVETSNINTLFGSLQVLKTVMRLKKKDQLN